MSKGLICAGMEAQTLLIASILSLEEVERGILNRRIPNKEQMNDEVVLLLQFTCSLFICSIVNLQVQYDRASPSAGRRHLRHVCRMGVFFYRLRDRLFPGQHQNLHCSG